ncbi:MAG TPA: TonB-dependent receptor [Chryseosolibacter sp.]|nr:TonB-dependent receptor [Chryseosolibacter sp.]
MTIKLLTAALLLANIAAQAQQINIHGTVKDAETRQPLLAATIYAPEIKHGTVTDENGNFTLAIPKEKIGTSRLIVSFIGYINDTIQLSAKQNRYVISLRADVNALQEVVVVSATMKEVSKMDSPIPVEIYTPALFYKNPSPSIFESLGMVNGVQPQLNCNVCNTGDIHINGMEGPYTMVLIDGMPIVSSLSTVYGLSGIPNSMVKRIEVVKGPTSTLYGSEAVGGLINIITKEPATSARLQTDISATTLQEYNADLSTKWKVKNAQALLGINYFNFNNKIDINDDNFTDITQQNRISLFNKWDFHRKENRTASIAARYIYEDRWGGELQWSRQYRGSGEIYGESIFTNRAEFIGSYQLPVKEKITFDYSYNYHLQDSYYGHVKYLADQHVAFAQLRLDKKIGAHDLLVGMPFRFVRYDDNTPGTSSEDLTNPSNRPMQTYLPGLFVQDEIAFSEKFTMLTGLRYDRHNHHGNIFSPRLSFKVSPNKNNTFRLSTGNGFRVVNLFTEDHAALTGSRKVVIANELRPEESWNVNLNYATNIQHAEGYVGIDASLFYTYFTNKIMGDFHSAPDSIIYDNLNGHAISKGITVNTDIAFTNGLKFIAGVTIMDVYQVEKNEQQNDIRTPQLFAPSVSGTYSISYSLDKYGLNFDLTGRVNGPMHLPTSPENGDYRPSKSPWYNIMNIQATKVYGSGLEIYAGIKNLMNFIPDDPLFYTQDPFAEQFDTTYNYAPVQGLKGFAGIRYTIQ